MAGGAALTVQVVVVGGGPAGLTAAIALAQAGIATALIAPRPKEDHRTTALLAGSVAALDTLGVWPRCRDQSAPLQAMRIVDATARLIRAPEVNFAADEIGLDAFGHNIQNRHLVAALDARTAELPSLRRIAGRGHRGADRRRQRHGRACERRRDHSATRDRRRRPALDLPRRCRHRDRRLDLSADRADLQPATHPAAPQHLDRIPHRERAVHVGATARRPVEPGLRGRTRRGAADPGARRRGARRRRSNGARIRSSARSRSSPAAAPSRSWPKPRAVSAATASR